MEQVILQSGEALFWLCLTLFAILGVASTVAYNFLGKMHELINAEKAVEDQAYRAELTRTIDKLKKSADLDSSTVVTAGRDLRKHEKQLRKRLKKLASLESVLDPKYTVVMPGLLLTFGFVFSNIVKINAVPYRLVAISIGYACLVAAVLLCMKNFANIRNLTHLLSPDLHIGTKCKQEWSTTGFERIRVSVTLRRGNSLHSLQTLLYLPPEFHSTAAFISKLRRPDNDYLMPGYNTLPSADWPVLKRDLPFVYDYDRLSCTKPGTYKLYYRTISKEFTSRYFELEVTVG